MDTPTITHPIPRELKEPVEYLQYVPLASPSMPSNEMRRLMIAYAIYDAVNRARGRLLIDTDLNTVIPKPLRTYALELAQQHGLLRKTEFKGKDAWTVY